MIEKYDKILVPELNFGHLRILLQSRFLKEMQGLNGVYGRPLLVSQVKEAILDML